jgi:hypothetical protein
MKSLSHRLYAGLAEQPPKRAKVPQPQDILRLLCFLAAIKIREIREIRGKKSPAKRAPRNSENRKTLSAAIHSMILTPGPKGAKPHGQGKRV